MTILLPLFPVTVLQLHETSVEEVDIDTGFNATDLISLSLPDFPAPDIDFENSMIEFTSHPDGDFNQGPTASVPWSYAEDIPTTAADHKLEFRRSRILGINKKQVTGVRLRIAAIADVTVRVLGIRLLDEAWSYAPVDTNTRYNRLVKPVSRSGEANPTSEFPEGANSPEEWPILWRADTPPGGGDPAPVDVTMAVAFNAGSMVETGNRISVYFREKALDYVTQLELDGDLMSVLNDGLQPDFGEAEYIPRTQRDLDAAVDTIPGSGMEGTIAGLTQADLAGETQFQLERKADLLSAAYIEGRFEWGSDAATFKLYDAEGGPFYSLTIPSDTDPSCTGANICPNDSYVLRLGLEENGLRLRINRLDVARIGDLVYDSLIITDHGVFKRRKGRVGWYAKLNDGDAYVTGFKPSQANYAEYRSLPFNSITPVSGAQLFAGASGEREFYRGIFASPWGGDFEGNPERSPESFRIVNLATLPLQGIQTNTFYIDNFEHTQVSFDLYVSQFALDAGSMEAFLWNGYQPLPLSLSGLQGDAWESVSLNLRKLGEEYLPGYYSLVIVQTVMGVPNDWFVDKLSVRTSQIDWEGRAYIPDAWDARENDWVSFYGTVNRDTGGVLFRDRAPSFQIRAKALDQQAQIGSIRTVPKYAELGRFAWKDQELVTSDLTKPTASFSFSVIGQTVMFDGQGSDSNGFITAWTWTLGDGATTSGPSFTHTYDEAGDYPVTLIVTDDNGQRGAITQEVTVT